MKHQTPTYIRKGKVIRTVETNETESFKSISQAKRRSLELQQQNGGRGSGFVRVEHSR